ncbi:MAG: PfkB family carbohydrate kinase [Planctomycetota bacterium]|nr:PfkB family carbohydrate kinase [Planctomycetota bacterium]
MRRRSSIITIGLSPAWDITCCGRNLDWDLHQYIDEQTVRPAGKALNVSKALAWMGHKNIAAGFWGSDDYQQMVTAVRRRWPSITLKMTTVPGGTRRNVTVVDTATGRDMHLRNASRLASAKTTRKLRADLDSIVRRGSICVFAGKMPEGKLLDDVVRLVEFCRDRRARIVLDTSGDALMQIVNTGAAWLIKPNVEELRELLGEPIKDGPVSLARAGRKLLDKVEIVLISRGVKGSVVVTKDGDWQARCLSRKPVLSTVGCGDYLLASFLNALEDKCNVPSALKTATKVATAKAWNWTETKTWPKTKQQLQIKSSPVL